MVAGSNEIQHDKISDITCYEIYLNILGSKSRWVIGVMGHLMVLMDTFWSVYLAAYMHKCLQIEMGNMGPHGKHSDLKG